MATLAYDRTGTGPPLVLLHGIGSSRASWDPVVPSLAERFELIAVDLPGFGDSPPLPSSVEPHPAALAEAVAGLLDRLGIDRPHVVGNSLGGWVALELAHQRPLATLTLLSPAGLWPAGTPVYCRLSLSASRWLACHAGGPLDRLVGSRAGRVVVLGQTHGRPARMSAAAARTAVTAMGTASGFDAVFAATLRRHYAAADTAAPITAPVTVAFGSRDRLLLAPYRRIDRLPAGTRVAKLPGCGHVPMDDDPVAVAAVITEGAARAAGRLLPVRDRC
jgi:pimeloyl-ACP methyl ester carboxylesterase